MNKIPIFNPVNTVLFIWEFINLVIILLYIYFIPLLIIYHRPFDNFAHTGVFYAASFILIIDILACMNTGYFDKGEYIKDRGLIAK